MPPMRHYSAISSSSSSLEMINNVETGDESRTIGIPTWIMLTFRSNDQPTTHQPPHHRQRKFGPHRVQSAPLRGYLCIGSIKTKFIRCTGNAAPHSSSSRGTGVMDMNFWLQSLSHWRR
mmetsp:Transcript_53564/g.79957  ORF Transcript_53564/g.79957 Transcript_53564/m.79957 type:complete len:119 (-) Transcript_53564:47-403(-)